MFLFGGVVPVRELFRGAAHLPLTLLLLLLLIIVKGVPDRGACCRGIGVAEPGSDAPAPAGRSLGAGSAGCGDT